MMLPVAITPPPHAEHGCKGAARGDKRAPPPPQRYLLGGLLATPPESPTPARAKQSPVVVDDTVLDCVTITAIVQLGQLVYSSISPRGDKTGNSNIALTASPIGSPFRKILKPGLEIVSPSEAWGHCASTPLKDDCEIQALRTADLMSRHIAMSGQTKDAGDMMYSLDYYLSMLLPQPMALENMPADARFLITLNCAKRDSLSTEHELQFATAEIRWIATVVAEHCVWLSRTHYVARRSLADPFVIVRCDLDSSGAILSRCAIAIGLPCVPASDILFGAPQIRQTKNVKS